MERRIRRLGIFMVLCFVALFVQLNIIQVREGQLAGHRPGQPPGPGRGPETDARGEHPVGRRDRPGQLGAVDRRTTSTSGSTTRTRRTLFAQIVGLRLDHLRQRPGVEAQYNSYLQSHTRPAKTLRDLLTNRTTTGNVTLTISTDAAEPGGRGRRRHRRQRQRPEAGAVVINVKTGAIEAMYGNPTYDPNPLVSPNIATEK